MWVTSDDDRACERRVLWLAGKRSPESAEGMAAADEGTNTGAVILSVAAAAAAVDDEEEEKEAARRHAEQG